MKKTYCANDKCEIEVYTTEDINKLLEGKSNTSDLENFYSKSEINSLLSKKSNTSDLENFYSKSEINSLLNKKQKTILVGSSIPNSSLGSDGDIYIQYF